MIAHLTQGSNDMHRSIQFYDALLNPLGIKRREQEPAQDEFIVCYKTDSPDSPLFFVVKPIDEQAATSGNGAMVAFQAKDTSQVDQCYEAGMNSGGVDEGKPGPRPNYSQGYYGAYLRDPDGNKVHIVYRSDV